MESMQTDLVQAVVDNDLSAVESALKAGADVNTVDSRNRNLLLIASVGGFEEMAELLVRYGADVNQQADNEDSPFLFVGATGQTALVKLFLENGARFDVYNRYGGSALIPACERAHVETVRLLANTKDYPIDHINKLGWTALLEAVILGNGGEKHQETVRILKDAGADLDIPDFDGVTSLQHARQRGFTEIVRILEK